MEPDTIVTVVVTVVLFILGLPFAWFFLKKDKAVDRQHMEEAGAFRKPSLGVKVYGLHIGEGYPDNETWLFIHPSKKGRKAIFPIYLSVFNEGDAPSDEPLLTIHVPSACFPASAQLTLGRSGHPKWAAESLEIAVAKVGHLTEIMLSLPSLRPKAEVTLELPLVLESTIRKISHKFQTKDKYPIGVDFNLEATYIVNILLAPRERSPTHYRLKIAAFPANSLVEGARAYLNFKNKALEKASKLSVFTKLRRIFTHVQELYVLNFISFDMESDHNREEPSEYIMKLPNVITRRAQPSSRLNELSELGSGTILSVVFLKRVPRTSRKFRKQTGNLIMDL